MHSRRSFFRLMAAAPALRLGASQKLIVRSANPEDFEMPLDGFQTWLTPVDRFFVRTHFYRPAVKMDDGGCASAARWRGRWRWTWGSCASSRARNW